MSTKQQKSGRTIKVTQKAADQGADDLEILNPDREIIIGGKKLIIREYRFVEGLEVRVKAKLFIDDLFALFDKGDFLPDEFIDLVAKHYQSLLPLVGLSADVDGDYFSSISEQDGNRLLMLWWGVNGPFFVRILKDRMVSQKIQANLAAGQISTPNSSPTDTAQIASSNTPSDR